MIESSSLSALHLASVLGTALGFVQDRQGCYHSFSWVGIAQTPYTEAAILANPQLWQPLAPKAYEAELQRVIEHRIPITIAWAFLCDDRQYRFNLTLTPFGRSGETQPWVLVLGEPLDPDPAALTFISHRFTASDSYQKTLTQVARRIRSTLDLPTIQQQTVTGLGEALGVDRCLMLTYHDERQECQVQSEYRRPLIASFLGQSWSRQEEPVLDQAIAQRQLIEVDFLEHFPVWDCRALLVVPTLYQNRLNGLILLQQCDHHRLWSQAERALIQELAEQIGTAIAHATLYQELEQARQAAEEASRLKSDFLASTTHELRTPLNGIIGFLQLVLDGMADDPQEQQEFLNEAHKSALHLLNLINDILDIAKIEAGKMDLQLEPVPLETVLETVAAFAVPQTQTKGLAWSVERPATYDPILLFGNYQRILQVVLNLVGNAIKFTPEGSVSLVVDIVAKTIQRSHGVFPGLVRISVADTGIGVALEKQDKLFQNFVQIHGGRTREYGGTGLGLAISQRLVEAMGGKISFYSMGEQLGSTVTFTIPLHQLPVIKSGEREASVLPLPPEVSS